MEEKELMSQALGIREPWYVTEIRFSAEEKRLDIYVDFRKGARFSCPTCGREDGMAYNRTERTWRHLNFFQYTAYIYAKASNVQCPKGCLIKNAELPWISCNSSSTLLFEALE